MICYKPYPKKVYLIFPYDENREIAGVYVGASIHPKTRIQQHIGGAGNEYENQKEFHKLMKENGYTYCVVDEIEDWEHSCIEYDWVDYFRKVIGLKTFNSKIRGSVVGDWLFLKNPKDKLKNAIANNKEKFIFLDL